MKLCIKTAALALAMTAAGATAALAGKTTTPNPTVPPVVTTVVMGSFLDLSGVTFPNVDSPTIQAFLDALD